MKHKKEQVMMKNMLSEAIMVLCKASLEYRYEFHIEGLIGITLDNEEIFLVNFNEHVNRERHKSSSEELTQLSNSNDNCRSTPSPIPLNDSPVPSPKSHKEWGPKSRRHLKRITPTSNSPSPVKQARVQTPPPTETEPLVIKPIEETPPASYINKSMESITIFPGATGVHNIIPQPSPVPLSGDGDASHTSGSEHGDRSYDAFPPVPSDNASAESSQDGMTSNSSATWIPPVVSEVAGENSHEGLSLSLPVSDSPTSDVQLFPEMTKQVGEDKTTDAELLEPYTASTSPDDAATGKKDKTETESSPSKARSSGSGRKTNECELCGKIFPHKLGLTYHMNTHLGYKPFECPECGRAFSQKGNMNQHMVTHTGRKDFRCPVCHQLFAQRQSCREHVRGHHKTDPTSFHYAEYRNPDSEKYKNSPQKS